MYTGNFSGGKGIFHFPQIGRFYPIVLHILVLFSIWPIFMPNSYIIVITLFGSVTKSKYFQFVNTFAESIFLSLIISLRFWK